MSGLGIITGLASETRCLRGLSDASRTRVRCAGADAARAAALARGLLADGCTALVSFGVAGALDPALRAGDVVVASGVVAGSQGVDTDGAWTDAVRRVLSGTVSVRSGQMADAAAVVSSPEAKRTLYMASGAVAVDMESHAVGTAAREAGAPFLIVRAIADTADLGIPLWMAGVVGADGQTRPMRFLAGVIARPGDLGLVVKLARASGRALRSLRRVAALLGPGFGFPVLGG